jgi:mono/diheme cytochrome c family protein
MTETLFVLLLGMPAGLLAGALLLEAFVLRENAREQEPAVLWLMFCAVVAAGMVVVVEAGLYMWRGDGARLGEAMWVGGAGLAGALAWWFKRKGRDRGVLYLRERFYGENPLEPPVAKPGQAFWILGWRGLAVVALAAAVGAVLRVRVGGDLLARRGGEAEVKGETIDPAEAALAAADVKPADVYVPGAEGGAPIVPVEPVVAEGGDPTRAELPSAEDSEKAAAMAAAAAVVVPGGGAAAVPGGGAMAPATGATAVPGTAAAGVPVATVAPVVAAEPARPVSRNSQYFSKVRPIFAKACVKCHGPEKQKGDLALHNPDAIRAGINGKPAVIPGNPEKSRVYACIVLPPDDPDFMPQKGQPLSMSDKKVLAEWIKSGADLGDGVSIPSGQGGVFLVDTIAEGLPEPDAAVVEGLLKDHVNVRRLSKNKRVLELDFSHSDRAGGNLRLAELAPVALNIHTLDLSRTQVKDADLAALAGMRNLSRLILSRTGITDAGIAQLAGCASLEEVNLYSTGVTDAGLAQLGALKSLKKVYVWQSKATAAGGQVLEQAVPGVVVSLGN